MKRLLGDGPYSYHMITFPNPKSIDLDMLEIVMEDSDLAHRYFLNLVTGEVVFFSDDPGLSEEDERLTAEIDGSNDYVAIERFPSHVAYQWTFHSDYTHLSSFRLRDAASANLLSSCSQAIAFAYCAFWSHCPYLFEPLLAFMVLTL